MGPQTAISARPPSRLRGWRGRIGAVAAVAVLGAGASACGEDVPRQDANEPEGEFPVEVLAAKFPAEQQLGATEEMRLEVSNPGEEQVPNLVLTVYTGRERSGGGPFTAPSEQEGLADENRPVWILENGYPKLASEAAPGDDGPRAARSVRGKSFAFGPLDPGDSLDVVWRLTPVQTGAYTVGYEVAAGLNGRAVAVGEDGGPVGGGFEVTITDEPPRLEVSGDGRVEATP